MSAPRAGHPVLPVAVERALPLPDVLPPVPDPPVSDAPEPTAPEPTAAEPTAPEPTREDPS